MPINTNLNLDPYYDDFDFKNQYHRVLFKPAYAVQARELTQLQTILQNQLEQFGDNIFQEGSIVKGCNFTQLNELKYVKVTDKSNFDPTAYIGGTNVDGSETQYELESSTGLKAQVVYASIGFETKDPDLNTFYIVYLNSTAANVGETFTSGETLTIKQYNVTDTAKTEVIPATPVTINVSTKTNRVGNSYGLKVSEGVIFQKGHFLYVSPQTIIVSKYMTAAEDGSVAPHNISVGFRVLENIKTALEDSSLYDNAVGAPNENAPGADRLQLVPVLTGLTTSVANADPTFFTLVRYANGSPVQVRDVSQYNVIGQEFARRTYEESGNYIVNDFKVKAIDRNTGVAASVGPGVAYIKGFRVENKGEMYIDIDPIANTDVITQQNQAVSLNYGGYLEFNANNDILGTITYDASGYETYATANLVNYSGTVIGTTRIKNITQDKIYIFGSSMANNYLFSEVDRIVGPVGYTKVMPTMKQTTNDILIYDTGMIGIKSMTDISLPVRTSKPLTGLTDTIVINAGTDEDYSVQQNDIVIIDSNAQNLNIQSVTKSLSDKRLTIVLVGGQSYSSTATIYFNKRFTTVTPHAKDVKTLYVKSSFNANTADNTKYSLGFPDVYKIVSIVDSSTKDVTDSFRLKTNQRDHYYDNSYIEYIPGRPLPASGLMTITMKAFKVNTATGQYFFTIGSYNTAEVDPNDIPTYTSSIGKVFSLRDSIDFRPHCNSIGNYTNAYVLGTAPTISANVDVAPTFTGNFLVPALDSSASVDYEYYLNRTDVITLDSYGNIAITKGKPAVKSRPETIDENRLVISEIYVPGYPALSPEKAAIQGKPEYAYRFKSTGVKTYTMKDIAHVESKVDKLMYYASLSMLEMSTQNLNITDENGLTRFKNGLMVDPFNDLSIADIKNAEYNAGLDFTEKSLIPSVKTYPINLKLSSSTGANIHPSSLLPEVGTIAANTSVSDVIILDQSYATNSRNCVSNFYNYQGTGFLYPEYDGAHDVVTTPTQNIDIDLASPFIDFAENLQEFIPLTSTSTSLVSSSTDTVNNTRRSGLFGKTRNTTTTSTTTDVFSDLTRSLQVLQGNVTEQKIGDFVTNFQFNPYMRARDVNILMTGLRPNTQHYIYFDGQSVGSFVAPGQVTDAVRNVVKSGAINTALMSDSSGVLAAVFSIPPETFFVGDRKLVISDADTFDSIDSAGTSGGILTYRAYNFSTTKTGLTATTRQPDIDIDETTTLRTVTTRTVQRRRSRRIDPIAQTFFIKDSMGQGADTVFVSQIDLYFKRKSSTGNGVTVMLREVNNGYPAIEVMPFSKIHLTSDQVNISDDASVATTITFTAPVRLDVEKEYCFVVMPDAADPDYLIYTSKVGGEDLVTKEAVIQDWGDGVMFTSTNDRAWQSYQDEDIKFTLYRKNFATADAILTFTNDDNEFFTIGSNVGLFQNGEIIYTEKALVGGSSANVGIVIDTNTVSGTLLTDTYSNGDYLVIYNNSFRDIFKVGQAATGTLTLDKPVPFTTGSYYHLPVTVGESIYFNYRSPETMVLEKSSGSSIRRPFASGNTIKGLKSGATAVISSVDNVQLSYIQPMILRTTDSSTDATITGKFSVPGSAGATTYFKSVPFNDKTVFNENGVEIYSKSNGPVTFELSVDLSNNGNVTTSPFVDIETAMMFAYQYKVSNNPLTTSKYISKVVELAEGEAGDAEDFKLYVTGYRPANTNINAYIRVQHSADSIAFESNDWIQLSLVEGLGVYSSTSNLNDFKEFVYTIPAANKTNGVISYNNATGYYQGYRRFAIKLEFEITGTNIGSVPRLLDYRGVALT